MINRIVLSFILSFFILLPQAYSSERKIKAVIFDLGGVVLTSSPLGKLELIERYLGIPPLKVKKNLKKGMESVKTGRLDELSFWKAFVQSQGGYMHPNWTQIWVSYYEGKTQVNPDVIKILTQLKTLNYKNYLLSNTTPFHDLANQKRSVYSYFDQIFLSFKTHLLKPKKEAYLNLLSEVRLKADEVIFVDDRLDNVLAAEKLGIRSIQFKSANDLELRLKQLGVPLN